MLGINFTANADTTITTTTTIRGTAKNVLVNHQQGTTSIDCDPTIHECYTQTTTTVIKDNNQVAYKDVRIGVTDENGIQHQISGRLVSQSSGILSNGSIQYFFQISEIPQP